MRKKLYGSLMDFLKPSRLVFRDSPNKPKTGPVAKPPAKPKVKPSAKPPVQPKAKPSAKPKLAPEEVTPLKEGREKAADDVAVETAKTKPKLATLAKSYYEMLDKGEPKAIEVLRRKAESDDVTMIDLQGGWEWLGLKEDEQQRKYGKLAQIYLRKEGDTLIIKDALDNTYKTKYGLGAGDLLPPSVTEVEITDLKGHTRRGTRQIKRGRVGYYTAGGKYIPVFGGYRIKPLAVRDEQKEPYKKAVAEEKQNYLHNKEANDAHTSAVTTTPAEVLAYAGRTDYPISSMKSLRTGDPDKLKADVGKVEAEKIRKAKVDLTRIEALLDHFSIRMDSKSEINGGLYLVAFNGGCSGMLGWKPSLTTRKEGLTKKLTDKAYLKEALKGLEDGQKKELPEGLRIVKDEKSKDGYYFENARGRKIEDLEKWAFSEVAKGVEPNNTVKFIQALQKGGKAHKFLGYEFRGGYDFDLNHLDTLNRLANKDQAELMKKLKELSQPIDSDKFFESLYSQLDAPQGMSVDDAVAYIKANRSRLGFLIGDDGQRVTLLDLVRMSKRAKGLSGPIDYNFTALKQYLDYPHNGGKKCCAYAVSTMLGLGVDGGSRRGKVGSVRYLAARLMRENVRRTGKEGIVFGYQNYRKGDVLIYRGGKKWAHKAFAHTGIVTFNREIAVHDVNGNYVGTERYIGVQDDGSDLQATIIPVNPRSHTWRHLAKALKNPRSRARYVAKYPEIAQMWEFRKSNPKTLRVKGNAGWYGDSSQTRGRIAFAIRTQALQAPRRVA